MRVMVVVGDAEVLCSTLTEAVDVLEQSVLRIESSSSASTSMSTSQLLPQQKQQQLLPRRRDAAGASSVSLNMSGVALATIKLH
jgi:hypothetical protein